MGQSEEIRDLVAAKSDEAVKLAKSIWNFAELAYEETRSCAAMVKRSKKKASGSSSGSQASRLLSLRRMSAAAANR